MDFPPFPPQVWRNDPLLTAGPDGLAFNGQSITALARKQGTPLYVYSARRIRENLNRLREALTSTGLPFHIRFAMKCNRFGPVLDLIRAEGDIGIDACSPREVALALAHGFRPDEISVTASNLSREDLALLAGSGVHLTSDTASSARRFADAAGPGASFGLRLDPPIPLERENGAKLNYVGGKFGVSAGDFDRVYLAARSAGLDVNTLHVHCGWAMQADHAKAFEGAVRLLAEQYRKLPGIQVLNVGGGLSHPHHSSDAPLPLAFWAAAIRRHLGSLPVTLHCEIGTFIMANAGLLVVEVNTAEDRRGHRWLGVNAGHAVNVYPYHYGIPLEIIPVQRPQEPALRPVYIGSNINEAQDLLASGIPFPDVQEGELLALYCTGAYGASMMSDHCLRGGAGEVLAG